MYSKRKQAKNKTVFQFSSEPSIYPHYRNLMLHGNSVVGLCQDLGMEKSDLQVTSPNKLKSNFKFFLYLFSFCVYCCCSESQSQGLSTGLLASPSQLCSGLIAHTSKSKCYLLVITVFQTNILKFICLFFCLVLQRLTEVVCPTQT